MVELRLDNSPHLVVGVRIQSEETKSFTFSDLYPRLGRSSTVHHSHIFSGQCFSNKVNISGNVYIFTKTMTMKLS